MIWMKIARQFIKSYTVEVRYILMRVAVDANILIAGVAYPRWPYEVLHHAERGDYTLVLSPIVILEAQRNIRRQFPDLVSDFQQFLELIDYEEAPLPTREEVKANPDLVCQKKDIPVALSIGAATL